jgi:hypothetical protein
LNYSNKYAGEWQIVALPCKPSRKPCKSCLVEKPMLVYYNTKSNSPHFAKRLVPSSEKLDEKIWSPMGRRHCIDDIFAIFVEFGEQPSKHLILIKIVTLQYIFNIFQYFTIHQ